MERALDAAGGVGGAGEVLVGVFQDIELFLVGAQGVAAVLDLGMKLRYARYRIVAGLGARAYRLKDISAALGGMIIEIRGRGGDAGGGGGGLCGVTERAQAKKAVAAGVRGPVVPPLSTTFPGELPEEPTAFGFAKDALEAQSNPRHPERANRAR